MSTHALLHLSLSHCIFPKQLPFPAQSATGRLHAACHLGRSDWKDNKRHMSLYLKVISWEMTQSSGLDCTHTAEGEGGRSKVPPCLQGHQLPGWEGRKEANPCPAQTLAREAASADQQLCDPSKTNPQRLHLGALHSPCCATTKWPLTSAAAKGPQQPSQP